MSDSRGVTEQLHHLRDEGVLGHEQLRCTVRSVLVPSLVVRIHSQLKHDGAVLGLELQCVLQYRSTVTHMHRLTVTHMHRPTVTHMHMYMTRTSVL